DVARRVGEVVPEVAHRAQAHHQEKDEPGDLSRSPKGGRHRHRHSGHSPTRVARESRRPRARMRALVPPLMEALRMRDRAHVVPALVLLGAAIACGASAPPAPPRRPVTFPGRTMGTYVNVTVVTSDSAASAPIARTALACFTRIDSLMSNWT